MWTPLILHKQLKKKKEKNHPESVIFKCSKIKVGGWFGSQEECVVFQVSAE